MANSSSATTPLALIDSNTIRFNGYPYDGASGTYLLGNGYRSYNAHLKTFHSRDSFSPFGIAGINRYQYCHLDPINFTDPSGHIGVTGGVAIGLSVLGAILGFVTFGAGFSLIGAGALFAGSLSIVGGVLGVVSAATAIASITVEDRHPDIAETLSWLSLGTGFASAFTGFGALNALRKAGLLGRAASRALQARGSIRPFRSTRAYLNPKNSPAASAGGRYNLNYQSGFGVSVAGPTDAISSELSATTKALLSVGAGVGGALLSSGIYHATLNRSAGADDYSVDEPAIDLLPGPVAMGSSLSSQTHL